MNVNDDKVKGGRLAEDDAYQSTKRMSSSNHRPYQVARATQDNEDCAPVSAVGPTYHIAGFKTCNFYRAAALLAKEAKGEGIIAVQVHGYEERSIYFDWLRTKTSLIVGDFVHETSPLVWKEYDGEKDKRREYIGGNEEFYKHMKDEHSFGTGKFDGSRGIFGMSWKILSRKDKARIKISAFFFIVSALMIVFFLRDPSGNKNIRWALYLPLFLTFMVGGQTLVC